MAPNAMILVFSKTSVFWECDSISLHHPFMSNSEVSITWGKRTPFLPVSTCGSGGPRDLLEGGKKPCAVSHRGLERGRSINLAGQGPDSFRLVGTCLAKGLPGP